MRKNIYKYSIIQYVPSTPRDERINIGVLLFDKLTRNLLCRYISTAEETNRIISFDRTANISWLISHLMHFKRACNQVVLGPDYNYDWAAAADPLMILYKERANTIQFAKPRTVSSDNIEDTLDDLYTRYVAIPL